MCKSSSDHSINDKNDDECHHEYFMNNGVTFFNITSNKLLNHKNIEEFQLFIVLYNEKINKTAYIIKNQNA